MVLIGKIHEISLYGLISAIICLANRLVSFDSLWNSAFDVTSFSTFFEAYLFWASVLFLPIAVIGAFATKYVDDGEGLLFKSDNIVVIIFAHIAEELLGIILTPFWFLKDIFTQDFDDVWKIIDYITYAIEVLFIFIGFYIL
ncbi:MAG: hypothetical protein IJ325_04230 [Clostridia bacterium]|nr:hypothetical protein [Clostridia bacterium]MBQ8640678.1 hypothetical protein [Clostridia bacterium]